MEFYLWKYNCKKKKKSRSIPEVKVVEVGLDSEIGIPFFSAFSRFSSPLIYIGWTKQELKNDLDVPMKHMTDVNLGNNQMLCKSSKKSSRKGLVCSEKTYAFHTSPCGLQNVSPECGFFSSS